MNVIVRNFNNETEIINVKNLSCSYNQGGIQVEVEQIDETLNKLTSKKFKCCKIGKILNIEVSGFTCF